jgi:hypothetical protein
MFIAVSGCSIPGRSVRRFRSKYATSRCGQPGDGLAGPEPSRQILRPVGAASWPATDLEPDGATVFDLVDRGSARPDFY